MVPHCFTRYLHCSHLRARGRQVPWVNTMRPRQNGRDFADDIFKCVFLGEIVWFSIIISLNFVPKGPIDNIPALVQIMAWRRPGDKPLSELMMVSLQTHICVTRPQWVNRKLQLFRDHGLYLISGIPHRDRNEMTSEDSVLILRVRVLIYGKVTCRHVLPCWRHGEYWTRIVRATFIKPESPTRVILSNKFSKIRLQFKESLPLIQSMIVATNWIKK